MRQAVGGLGGAVDRRANGLAGGRDLHAAEVHGVAGPGDGLGDVEAERAGLGHHAFPILDDHGDLIGQIARQINADLAHLMGKFVKSCL